MKAFAQSPLAPETPPPTGAPLCTPLLAPAALSAPGPASGFSWLPATRGFLCRARGRYLRLLPSGIGPGPAVPLQSPPICQVQRCRSLPLWMMGVIVYSDTEPLMGLSAFYPTNRGHRQVCCLYRKHRGMGGKVLPPPTWVLDSAMQTPGGCPSQVQRQCLLAQFPFYLFILPI